MRANLDFQRVFSTLRMPKYKQVKEDDKVIKLSWE